MTPSLFDEAYYLAYNADVAQAVAQGLITAEEHFKLFGKAEGRAPGPMFDVEYYLATNPDVHAAVRAGLITAYDHFLLYGADEVRSPLIVLDIDYYLARNPDIAAAGRQGFSPVQHFLLYGNAETRAISPFIDLGKYLDANPDVADAVAAGQISPMAHLLSFGAFEGRDLGNGISLGFFANDPQFIHALEIGNLDLALARMYAVAPFLPTFEPPAGWKPAPHTPIPVDFIPPAGMKLVVPDGVIVPPELLPLPDTFEPIDNGGGGGDGDAPTFSVTAVSHDDHIDYTFSGTARGDISVKIGEDSLAAFTRQGVTATTKIDFNAEGAGGWEAGKTFILLQAHDNLALSLEQAVLFSLISLSDCGCEQHEAFVGDGLIRLNTNQIFEVDEDAPVGTIDFTVFSPGLRLDFNGSNTIEVGENIAFILSPQHADGLDIVNLGDVYTVFDEYAGKGVTLNIASDAESSFLNFIGATNHNDQVTVSGGTSNAIYTGAGDDIIKLEGGLLNIIEAGAGDDTIIVLGSSSGEDDDDCGCPELSLNAIFAGTGADQITLNGGTFSYLVVTPIDSRGGGPITGSDSFWSASGGTWDVVAGFRLDEDDDTGFTDYFSLLDDDPDDFAAVGNITDETVTLSDSSTVTFSVADGVATVQNSDTLALGNIVEAMSIHITGNTHMVAFVHGDNSYFFLSDGVAGIQNSDTFIELIGVKVTNMKQLWDSWGVVSDLDSFPSP